MLNTRTKYFCQVEISYRNPAGKGEMWLIENQTQFTKQIIKRILSEKKIA